MGPQAIPGWGSVKPFVMTSASQFRSPPMYGTTNVADAVKTALYLQDYDEVQRLGGMVSERTQDQTDIAFFWIESTIQGWNRIARHIADKRQLGAWRLARLLLSCRAGRSGCIHLLLRGEVFLQLLAPGNGDPARQPRSEHGRRPGLAGFQPAGTGAWGNPADSRLRLRALDCRRCRGPGHPRQYRGHHRLHDRIRHAAWKAAQLQLGVEGRAARTPTPGSISASTPSRERTWGWPPGSRWANTWETTPCSAFTGA
jgi:hypothetical protein